MSEKIISTVSYQEMKTANLHEKLAAEAELPIIQINGDQIRCFSRRNRGASHSVDMLTEHLVFTLCQNNASSRHRFFMSQDTGCYYKSIQVIVPANFWGTSFVPCYAWQELPDEYREDWLEEESQPAKVSVELDPQKINFNDQDSPLAFAYCLCLPGNMAILISSLILRTPFARPLMPGRMGLSAEQYQEYYNRIVQIDPTLAVPFLDMTVVFRECYVARDYLCGSKKRHCDQKNLDYLQKVKETYLLYKEAGVRRT